MTDRLQIVADLRLDVDDVRAQVVGSGSDLVITTDRPVRLLRLATASRPLRGSFGSGLRRLTELGLTVHVEGSRGPLAVAGAGVTPRLGLPPVRPSAAVLRAGGVLVGALAALVVGVRLRTSHPAARAG